MCIIVVKPAGVEFPTWKTLKNCFDANPDGAGFMYNNGNGDVSIEKGFMTWSAFRKAVKLLKRRITNDTNVVMHFRIATHGEVSRECCHPFPLSNKIEKLRMTETDCNVGIAHNGIIHGRKTSKLKSDTMDYIQNFLHPLYKLNRGFYQNKASENIIEETIDGSRLAIIDGKGSLKMYGRWYSDFGCYFSNTSYEGIPRISPYSSASNGAWSEWWDEYDDDDVDWKDPYSYGSFLPSKKKETTKTVTIGPAPCEGCDICQYRGECVENGEWFCYNTKVTYIR